MSLTAAQHIHIKYVGTMFGTIVGGYLATVDQLAAGYGGNVRALMRDLSLNRVWINTNGTGTTREIAHDLVNRLVGNTAAASDKEWAVNWFIDMKNAGQTWGDILFQAFTALDGIQGGAWGAAGDAFRARANYNVEATEGWAANFTDMGTMRDVYSAAVSPKGYTPSASLPSAISQLQAASAALATGAAGVGAQAAATTYTVVPGDAGKAIMLGAGNDTAMISWGDLDKVALLSGGDGYDTLTIVDNGSADFNTFFNKYGGLFDDQAIRGFEKITFSGGNTPALGSFDGLKEVSLAPAAGFNFDQTFYGADTGQVFNLSLSQVGQYRVKFSDAAPYGNVAQTAAAQSVDKLSFNVTAAGNASLYLPGVTAKNVSVNWTAPAGANGIVTFADINGSSNIDMPNLEKLSISSPLKTNMVLTAPNLTGLDFTGSTGSMEFRTAATGAKFNDGVKETFLVTSPTGLVNLDWSSALPNLDTVPTFGTLKAGSQVKVVASANQQIGGLHSKAIFSADFSEANYYKSIGWSATSGSEFQAAGIQYASVYFQGVAPAGQMLGTVNAANSQVTTIKVDSPAGVAVKVAAADKNASLLVFINNGGGSVLDNVRASVQTQLGMTLQEKIVSGGRILFADVNGDGLTGQIFQSHAPGWMVSPDFVMMETTSANLATMSNSVQLLGFQPLFDVFA